MAGPDAVCHLIDVTEGGLEVSPAYGHQGNLSDVNFFSGHDCWQASGLKVEEYQGLHGLFPLALRHSTCKFTAESYSKFAPAYLY